MKEALENGAHIARTRVWPIPNATIDRRVFAACVLIFGIIWLAAELIDAEPRSSLFYVVDIVSAIGIPAMFLGLGLLFLGSRRTIKKPTKGTEMACARIGVKPDELWLPPVMCRLERLARQGLRFAKRYPWPTVVVCGVILVLLAAWTTGGELGLDHDTYIALTTALTVPLFAVPLVFLLGIAFPDSTEREQIQDELFGAGRVGYLLDLEAQLEALTNQLAELREQALSEVGAFYVELSGDVTHVASAVFVELKDMREDADRRDRVASRKQLIYFGVGLLASFVIGLLAVPTAELLGWA